jgi:short-subunit dehydrogenase
VYVSSQASIRGMPTAGVYAASKSAGERWAEALAHEVAPFGVAVTIVVPGAFDTDILVDTTYHQQQDTAYGVFRDAVTGMEHGVKRMAMPPDRFAAGLERALDDDRPYKRRPVGKDAYALLVAQRLLPDEVLHRTARALMRTPRPGELREPRPSQP